MNKKMMIQDINRRRVPLCDLKKMLFIDDDIKLANTLIDIVEIGINALRPSIIRSNFMYIIYSMQYLKFLKNKYPEIEVDIESHINIWGKQIQEILKDKKIKKNTMYYSFINDILDELKCISPDYIDEQVVEEQEKNILNLSLKKAIDQLIENSSNIDIINLNKLLHTYMEEYSLLDKKIGHWKELGHIITILQDQLISIDDKDKELVICEFIEILQEYYNEYYNSVVKENRELFHNYINNNYKEKLEIYNRWDIQGREEDQPYIITVDDECSLDLDDALAVTDEEFGMTLHIYIANTTPFLLNNPTYDPIAFERYSSLYFHKKDYQNVYHMLPQDCVNNMLSLNEKELRSVIDHEFYVDYFGKVSYRLSYKNIVVNKRLSYSEVDEMIQKKSGSDMMEYLCALEKCIQLIYGKMKIDDIYRYTSNSESRAQKIVSSAAILVNYVTATEAIKNNFVLLYQDYCSGKYYVNAPETAYIKITAPIRRYSDLKNNYLLDWYLKGNVSDSDYYKLEKDLKEMLPELEERKERNKQFSKIGTLHLNNKI